MGFHHTTKIAAGVKPVADIREARVLRAFLAGLDTPVSLGIWLRYEWREHNQLANLKIEPRAYCDRRAFQRDYAAVSYLSKFEGLQTGVDVRAVALSAHDKAEELNTLTNRLFRMRASGEYSFFPRVEAAITLARHKIARVLEGWTLAECVQSCRYGPGSTSTLARREATPWNKTTSLSVTAPAARHAKWLIADPVRFEAITGIRPEGPYSPVVPLQLVEGNKLTTVPKNAKTDRCICIEPSLNIELQLGVGAMLRDRLRTFCRIDLDDQTRNQVLAQKAYDHGYATLDLSAASDSISTELVFDLLPVDFALYLDEIRSRYTHHPAKGWGRQQKFASMGNGFCFELETLIFWALSSSIAGWAAVYGDDIIIPARCASDVIECLTAVGFRINDQKSYWSGCFFESCGKHYYEGTDVTPVFQKEIVADESSALRFINRIRRLAYRLGDGVFCDSSLRSSWADAVELYFGGKPRLVQPLVNGSGELAEGDFGIALSKEELEALGIATAAWPMRCPGIVAERPTIGSEYQLALYYCTMRRAPHKEVSLRTRAVVGAYSDFVRTPASQRRDFALRWADAFSRGTGLPLSGGIPDLGLKDRYRRKAVLFFDGVNDARWY